MVAGRFWGFVLFVLMAGCTMAHMEEGQFSCAENGDCPEGWLCDPCSAKCYSQESLFEADCDGGDGACLPTNDTSYTQCGGGDVHWFDDCGNETGIQTRCSDTRGTCINIDDRSAQCGCEGNWDAADNCNSCRDNWDISDNCNSCLGNWDGSQACNACLAGYGDVNGDDCNSCVRYVNGALKIDDGDRDGQAWATAWLAVQDGIDGAKAAVDEDAELEACEVWVAEGEYIIYTNIESTVLLKPNVHVYGSFVAGTPSRDKRGEWRDHRAILNGKRDPDSQVYHVVTGSDDATLDGFVITGGKARSEGSGDDQNRRGGGMMNIAVSPTIRNCIFEENSALDEGGAMYTEDGAPIVSNCVFTLNDADIGGAVYAISSMTTFRNCIFQSNTADNWGGAMYNENSSPLIINSVFMENDAGDRGGAIVNFDRSSAEMTNCTVYGNTTGDGSAAIDNRYNVGDQTGSEIEITGSIIWGNLPAQVVNTDYSYTSISHSNIEGGCDLIFGGTKHCSDTQNEDPSFVDEGVELMPDSPCIDQADGRIAPLTDIIGNGRYDDPSFANATNCGGDESGICIEYADMGAYEYQGPYVQGMEK